MTAGVRILIVADKPDLRSGLNQVLEDLGLETEQAAGVAEAHSLASRQSFHAALAALPLEGTSPAAFLKQWKLSLRRTPVILVSASPTVDEVASAISAGAFDYLPQPLNPRAVLQGIERALEAEPAPLSMDEMTREHLIRVLQYCKGNRSRAAELLGVGRYSIYRMARRLEVDLDHWSSQSAAAHTSGYADLEQRVQSQTRELEVVRGQLGEFDRTRSGLSRLLSEDISIPLSVQVEALEQLRGTSDAVAAPIEAARRMLERVGDMLELLRFDEQPMPLVRRWTPAMEILDAAYAAADGFARAAGIVLTRRLGADLPPLLADADRMSQALSQLLFHAISRTPPGGTILLEALRMHDEESNAGVVRISVLHEGDALKAEALAYAFDPLWGSGADAGKRLGLALAKRLVSAHGGSLTIAAHPGAGNEFQILLPAQAQSEEPAASVTDVKQARNEVGQA